MILRMDIHRLFNKNHQRIRKGSYNALFWILLSISRPLLIVALNQQIIYLGICASIKYCFKTFIPLTTVFLIFLILRIYFYGCYTITRS
jgi:hypothetical protein